MTDCGGPEPTACSNDILAATADVNSAVQNIDSAVISCGAGNKDKCEDDVGAATKSLASAGLDIAKAVADC